MKTIPIYQVRLCKTGVLKISDSNSASTSNAARILRQELENLDREHLVMLLVNSNFEVIGYNTLAIGTLDTAYTSPREVFKPALLLNAAGIILGHNHPSGDPTPSQDDIKLTKQLAKAGTILGIPILDHIIIGRNDYTSLRPVCNNPEIEDSIVAERKEDVFET